MSRDALLAPLADRSADGRVAVICPEATLTWDRLWRAIGVEAARLRASGVRPGDRVMILSEHCHRAHVGWFGVVAAGGCATPVNPRLTALELGAVLDHGRPRVVLAHPELREHAQDAIAAAQVAIPLVVLGADGPRAAVPDPATSVSDDDPVAMYLTSGSTGRPKGVALSASAFVANSGFLAAAAELAPDMRYLHLAPGFHLADGAAGVAATLLGHTHRYVGRFRADRAAAAIRAGEADWTVCVPAIVSRLAQEPGLDAAPPLARLVYGGAAMPRSTLEQVAATWVPRPVQTYGLSETTSVVSALTADEHRAALDGSLDRSVLASIGRPVSGVEVRLDPASREIQVRGPNLMLGYWNGDTVERRTADDWLPTGDVAEERDGYLMLRGRLKDVINTGGEKVHAAEVERAILGVKGVLEVAVIGVPDEAWGERIHAVVRVDDGLTETRLRDGLTDTLARYKQPRSWDLTTQALPVTGSGKVDRVAIRAAIVGAG